MFYGLTSAKLITPDLSSLITDWVTIAYLL